MPPRTRDISVLRISGCASLMERRLSWEKKRNALMGRLGAFGFYKKATNYVPFQKLSNENRSRKRNRNEKK